MVLKFREVLKETERLEPDDLWEYQKNLLTPLLLHARKHAPFYKTRLNAVFNGDGINFDKWREIPLLTREEAQKNEKALAARMVPPHLGAVSADETSGSTGRPLRYLKNELMSVAGLAMMDRLYRWWKFDGNKPLANFISPRRTPTNDSALETYGWRTGFLQGRRYSRDTSGDMNPHLDWLTDIRPAYLVSYASMVAPLARSAKDRDLQLRFEHVVTRGGVVSSETRELCNDVFGAPLIDQYGADEIGQIACQCPVCGAYHINAEVVLVEVINEAGALVEPGETGRVVLTNFYNYAMPLIRYEIGDFATACEPGHACQIQLPALERIVGRYRNTFPLADGRVLFPNVPMDGFRKFIGFSQIQIVQTDYDKIEVRYVPDGSGRSADEKRLGTWLCEGLGASFEVQAMAVEEIQAASDGKYEDFLSLVG